NQTPRTALVKDSDKQSEITAAAVRDRFKNFRDCHVCDAICLIAALAKTQIKQFALQPLKYSRGAHAAADAHRHHAVTSIASFQLAQDRGGEFRSRASKRMAQRDRAAVHVDLIGIKLKHLDHCER